MVNPFSLVVRRGELPPNIDADPGWRSNSVYTRDEATSLMFDERVPLDRRVAYALQFLGGMRPNEAAGRRFRDWHRDRGPLGMLLVATQGEGKKLKVEGRTREVPVHRVLADVLVAWEREGFELVFGRPPTADDFIIPSRGNIARPRSKKMLERMKQDLERLKLRTKGRGRHALRRTFISLASADGARKEVLRTITHDGTGDVFDGYTSWPWPTCCAEVSKLRIVAPRAPVPTPTEPGPIESAPSMPFEMVASTATSPLTIDHVAVTAALHALVQAVGEPVDPRLGHTTGHTVGAAKESSRESRDF